MHIFRNMDDAVRGTEMSGWDDCRLAERLNACRQAEDNSSFQANPDIVERQVGDEWLLVPVGKFAEANNCMISLNGTSHFLWSQFKNANKIENVLQATRDEYEDEDSTLELEVREFVRDYVGLQLLLECRKDSTE